MNYLGVILSALSIVLFAMAGDKPAEVPAREVPLAKPEARNLDDSSTLATAADLESRGPGAPVTSPSPPKGGFLAGMGMAVVAGILFGSNFAPPTVLEEKGPPKHSSNS